MAVIRPSLVLIFCATILAGCGGGGGGGSDGDGGGGMGPPDSASGRWTGTVNFDDGGARSFTGVVLDDGEYWLQYSLPGEPATLGGMVTGTGEGLNGRFTSAEGLDFALDRIFSPGRFSLAANYAARSRFSGNLDFALAGLSPFATSYDPSFDLSPNLATIAGHYSMTGILVAAGVLGSALTIDEADLTLAADGTASGSYRMIGVAECEYTVTVTPRADANVYDVVLGTGFSCGLATAYTGVMTVDAGTQLARISLRTSANGLDIGMALMGTRD